MKKLVNGIVTFRKTVRPDFRETFARLALGQSPDTLMIACSDSRVVPNLFASADPGDLFVVRNVGNLVAPCGADGMTEGDESEPAAIEFALSSLQVTDIIVCGHSECGAMRAVVDGIDRIGPKHLKSWLGHAVPSLKHPAAARLASGLSPHNRLSQLNILQQMDHLKTYPLVKQRLAQGSLRLHGWWFDIAQADVHAYEPDESRFALIDEAEAERILKTLKG